VKDNEVENSVSCGQEKGIVNCNDIRVNDRLKNVLIGCIALSCFAVLVETGTLYVIAVRPDRYYRPRQICAIIPVKVGTISGGMNNPET